MSRPSFEPLRRSALAMLDDGNAVESVAHLLGVPVDVVRAWRENPRGEAPASAFVDTLPPEDVPPPAPARDARARLRFDGELVYAASTSFRAIGLAMGIVLGVLAIGFPVAILRQSTLGVSEVATSLTILLVGGGGARLMLGWSRRILVLGTDGIVVPRLFGGAAMGYPDVAGYTLEPHALRLGRGSAYQGRMLSIQSRRPGAAALAVFLFDDYPVDPAMFERLDEVVRATRGLPPLPALVGAGTRGTVAPGRVSFTMLAVMMLLGALQLLPLLVDGLRTLGHGTPPLSALRHVEGKVTAVSRCWTRSRRSGGAQVMTVVVADPAGSADVIVPCILDHDELLNRGPHRLAVDLDPAGRPQPVVYQVAEDGRVVLAWDTVRARHRHDDLVPARVIVVVLLAVFAGMLFLLRLAWVRSHPRGADD
jgi:hypothetical protein